MKPAAAVALAALLAAGVAVAGEQPYAGLQHRPVKGLSAAEIDDLLAGRGMGMALPAELNGYPGPKHVLELARPLGLSETQHWQTQRLFDEMQRSAASLGRALVVREAALDRLFADAVADESGLREETAEIARLQGELRFLHLRYHLAMRELLTAEQVVRYRHIRGYDGQQPHAPHSGHGHKHGRQPH